MLFLFVYFPFSDPVVQVTTGNWNADIKNYTKHGVAVILFHAPKNGRCKSVHSEFQEAAEKSAGLLRFGAVDMKSDPKIGHLFDVRALPAVRIIHRRGAVAYNGNFSPQSLISQGEKYLTSEFPQVNDSWFMSQEPSVIYFSNKYTAPPVWHGINNAYGAQLRVGFSNQAKRFNVSFVPSIMFINGETHIEYDGNMNFTHLSSIISEFINDPNIAPKPIKNMDSMEEFERTCMNTPRRCVIKRKSADDSEFFKVGGKKKYNSFKFITCTNCPYQMDDDAFYLIHPTERSYYEMLTLEYGLDQVIDGSVHWTEL